MRFWAPAVVWSSAAQAMTAATASAVRNGVVRVMDSSPWRADNSTGNGRGRSASVRVEELTGRDNQDALAPFGGKPAPADRQSVAAVGRFTTRTAPHQPDTSVVNRVDDAPTSMAETVASAFPLPDGTSPAAVVRVGGENMAGFPQHVQQIGVVSRELPDLTLECGGRAKMEPTGHSRVICSCSSSRNSSSGRPSSPARTSRSDSMRACRTSGSCRSR